MFAHFYREVGNRSGLHPELSGGFLVIAGNRWGQCEGRPSLQSLKKGSSGTINLPKWLGVCLSEGVYFHVIGSISVLVQLHWSFIRPSEIPWNKCFFFWLGGATWWSKVALSVASGCLGLWILAMTDRCWFSISPVSYFLHLFIVWNPSRNCKHFSSHRLPSLARSLHNHL